MIGLTQERKLIAFDFDGVLNELELDYAQQRCSAKPQQAGVEFLKQLQEEHDVIIITGRDKSSKECTEALLRNYGIAGVPVYYNHLDAAILPMHPVYKAAMIKKLGVDIYVEDLDFIVNFLREENIASIVQHEDDWKITSEKVKQLLESI